MQGLGRRVPLAWGYRLRLGGAAGRSGACDEGGKEAEHGGCVESAAVVRMALLGTGTAGGAGFGAKDAPGLGVQTSAGRRGGLLRSR